MEQRFKRTCFKVHFQSRNEAKKVLKMLKQNPDGRYANNETVYFCKECLAWHTTSMGKKRSRRITRQGNRK